MSVHWKQQHQDEELDYMDRPKGGKGGKGRKGAPPTKGADRVETRKCHWCDLPGHLVRDCPAKKAGKAQKPGLVRKGGARKGGGRSAGALGQDDDYEESILGQERDGGSLEYGCGSLMFDCEE